jgi:hypothetical protein
MSRTRCLAALLVVAAAALALAPAGTGGARAEGMAFTAGERLHYELKWGPITAAYGTLEVVEVTLVEGKPAWHFALTARSNAFIDRFFKCRDRVDSWTNFNITHSLLFKQKQREGHYKRDVIVRFDPLARKSERHSLTSGNYYEIDILPGTFDPFSIFYFFRSYAGKLEPGMVLENPVSDGKRCVMAYGRVIRREKVKTDLGVFDCLLIEPDMSDVGGVFKKSDDATVQVWVTDDAARIPVKLRSKVVVGHFSTELIGIERAGTMQGKRAVDPDDMPGELDIEWPGAPGEAAGDETGNQEE